ncbi:hypothetical protein BACCOPRO_03408 [Phocaeicola coprophilus DSM 18228 = JCM 13818]|uniref:Uncharacterized protein n=1 Tax=Phocaeicola coprophilus DSM 18228 = JCM 13818 TaxID=547042 RepID=S0FCK8_9BACT|nr:hypothetical protein BACCOPRO_03408 [Phocaeicola coprophilus DSM 18228 = JCM 13818]
MFLNSCSRHGLLIGFNDTVPPFSARYRFLHPIFQRHQTFIYCPFLSFSYSFFPLIAARLPVPFYHLQWRAASDCIPTFRSGMFSCAKVRRKNALQVSLSLPEVKFDVTFRNQRFRYS